MSDGSPGFFGTLSIHLMLFFMTPAFAVAYIFGSLFGETTGIVAFLITCVYVIFCRMDRWWILFCITVPIALLMWM